MVATEVHNLIHHSFNESCPTKNIRATNKVLWWTKELDVLRSKARKLFNKAKKAKRQEIWELYRIALTNYNKELRRSRRRTWRNFCEGINEFPAAATENSSQRSPKQYWTSAEIEWQLY